MPNDTTTDQLNEDVLSEKESEKMDDDLFEIELICRARCVTPSTLNNVVVREIDDTTGE